MAIGVAVEGAGGRFVDGDLIGRDGGGGHLQLRGQPVDRQAGGLPGDLPGPQARWAHRHHRRGRRGPTLSPPDRAERGAWVGCIAGALSKGEYEAGLAAAGFTDIHVAFTHQVGDGLHSAVIRATRPVGAASASTATDPVARTTLPMASDPACC